MTNVVNQVAEALNSIDVMARNLKLKPAEAVAFKQTRLLDVMQLNEHARIADALYAIAMRLPAPLPAGRFTDRHEWIESHPTQYAWLHDLKTRDSFARSLLKALDDFGTLTASQQAALDRASGFTK